MRTIFAIIIMVAGLIVWLDIKNSSGESLFHVSLIGAVAMGLLLIYIISDQIRNGNLVNPKSIYIILALSGFFVHFLGKTYGYYTVFRSPFHKIVIDEKQNMRTIIGARIVLLTSHHDVFIVADRVETFPTESVREISADTKF